jgi:hypothetical protein
MLCTLTPEAQCQTFHRNHVIWRTKITKFWRCCQHLPLYISDIRQIVRYRTPVFIQPFPWRLHITITYYLSAISWLSLYYISLSRTQMISFLGYFKVDIVYVRITVVSNHVNSDYVPSFSLLGVWNVRQTTFDPQLKKILTFSVKDRYQLNYFIFIKDFMQRQLLL